MSMKQVFTIENVSATLNRVGAGTAIWIKRIALASIAVVFVAAGTIYVTIDTILPHAHNVYSAAKLVYGESRGESYEGQKATFASIIERKAHPRFPDTIHDVVFQPYSNTDKVLQYNAMGDHIHEDLSTELGQLILWRVAWWYAHYELGIFNAPNEARSAHSYCVGEACEKQKSYFGTLKQTGSIGNHIFFTDCECGVKTAVDNAVKKTPRPLPRPKHIVPEKSDTDKAVAVAMRN